MYTFSVIGVGAVLLTVVALRWRHIAWAISATLAWAALFFYNISTPLSGITLGSFAHNLTIFAILMAMIGTMTAYLVMRNRGYTGYDRTAQEQREFNTSVREAPESKGIMQMSESEYRNYIHKRHVARARR